MLTLILPYRAFKSEVADIRATSRAEQKAIWSKYDVAPIQQKWRLDWPMGGSDFLALQLREDVNYSSRVSMSSIIAVLRVSWWQGDTAVLCKAKKVVAVTLSSKLLLHLGFEEQQSCAEPAAVGCAPLKEIRVSRKCSPFLVVRCTVLYCSSWESSRQGQCLTPDRRALFS